MITAHLVLLLGCTAPEESTPPTGPVDLTVDIPAPEEGYQVLTEPQEVPPYTEFRACSVVRLEPHGDEEMTWVSDFRSVSSVGSHHMNALLGTFSFLDIAIGDGAAEEALGFGVGTYDCDDLNLMAVAFTFFPSQRNDQRITLPPGVAAPFSTPLLMILDHHYVNTSGETHLINGGMNFSSVDPGEVKQVAELMFDDIGDISIEPKSREVLGKTCVVDRAVDVALVSTHTHARAECTTLNRFDGTSVDPEPFFVNRQWETPPILHFQPDSFHLEPGSGIQWSCHYANNSDGTVVNDGTADGEMCVFAAATYPSRYTVDDILTVVQTKDLAGLAQMMGDVLGPCDQTVDAPSPYTVGPVDVSTSEEACASLPQTESNTLY